jgi:hypothetical protein
MTSSTPELNEASRPAHEHATRLPYEAPELIDQGDVTEQTKSTAGGTGADGTYS